MHYHRALPLLPSSETKSEIKNLAAHNFDVLAVSGLRRWHDDLTLDGYKYPKLSDQEENDNMSYIWVKNKGEVTDSRLPWLKISMNENTVWIAVIEDIEEGPGIGMNMPENLEDQDFITVFQTKDRKAKVFAREGKTTQIIEHDILERSMVTLHLPTSPPYSLKVLQRHTL